MSDPIDLNKFRKEKRKKVLKKLVEGIDSPSSNPPHYDFENTDFHEEAWLKEIANFALSKGPFTSSISISGFDLPRQWYIANLIDDLVDYTEKRLNSENSRYVLNVLTGLCVASVHSEEEAAQVFEYINGLLESIDNSHPAFVKLKTIRLIMVDQLSSDPDLF